LHDGEVPAPRQSNVIFGDSSAKNFFLFARPRCQMIVELNRRLERS